MKATVRPYESKYYGTIIDLKDKYGDDIGEVTIYSNWGGIPPSARIPSIRELELCGFEDWDDWAKYDKEEGFERSHSETQYAYTMANWIAETINQRKEDA